MRYFVYSFRIFVFCTLLIAAGSFAARAESDSQFLQWNFKVTGEERLRYEEKKDFDFNAAKKDNGGQVYNRFRLGTQATLTDEYLNPIADFFLEGLDAKAWGDHIKAVKTQIDDFDLHQAYFDLYNIFGSDFSVKLGRQELKYGAGRLIAAPVWANEIRAFDAGVIHYQHGGFWTDLLYGQEVKYKDEQFNASREEEYLTGAYGGYQANKMLPLVEIYFLEQKDIKGKNDIHRYTAGGRIQATVAEGTVLELELPYQFGTYATSTVKKQEIKAYAYHADIAKTWAALPWQPKLAIAYDEASGDKNGKDHVNNDFIPLYQSTHEPYGIIDLFRWENLRNPEVSTCFSPTEKFKFTPQADFFWLQNKNSPWYSSSGTAFRSKTSGKRNSFVGTELSLRGYYALTKNLNLEAGYAHFFSGPYVKASGKHDDIDWVYFQIAYKL